MPRSATDQKSSPPTDEGASAQSFRHRFEGPFFRRLMVGGVKRIPAGLRRASLPFWATLFYGALPTARRAVQENLRRALVDPTPGEVRSASWRLFLHYARTMNSLYGLHLQQPLEAEVSFEGLDHVRRIAAAGRGAVTLTGHLGPWQLLPYLLQGLDVPPVTMAMAEEPNARVSEFEAAYRRKFSIVYTTRSPFSLLELLPVLQRRELVGIQLDRQTGGPCLSLPFCGRDAHFPIGGVVLARVARVPLLPLFTFYDGPRRIRVVHEEPFEVPRTRDKNADLREALGRVVEIYERYVRRHPDQWCNFHDFWEAPAEPVGAAR